jgi:hypothetical protein
MAELPENQSYLSALATLGSVHIVFKLALFGSREKHLPHGPPTYPIVGNAHLAVDKHFYRRSVHFLAVLRHTANQSQVQRFE